MYVKTLSREKHRRRSELITLEKHGRAGGPGAVITQQTSLFCLFCVPLKYLLSFWVSLVDFLPRKTFPTRKQIRQKPWMKNEEDFCFIMLFTSFAVFVRLNIWWLCLPFVRSFVRSSQDDTNLLKLSSLRSQTIPLQDVIYVVCVDVWDTPSSTTIFYAQLTSKTFIKYSSLIFPVPFAPNITLEHLEHHSSSDEKNFWRTGIPAFLLRKLFKIMKRICIAFASNLEESSVLKPAAEASLHKVLKASSWQLEKGSKNVSSLERLSWDSKVGITWILEGMNFASKYCCQRNVKTVVGTPG